MGALSALVFVFAQAQNKFAHHACNGAALRGAMAGPIHTQINGKNRVFISGPDTTLLFALREELGLTGTKYGCGEGQCGACTVLLNGTPRRSCQLSVSDAAGKSMTTVEGFEHTAPLHPVH